MLYWCNGTWIDEIHPFGTFSSGIQIRLRMEFQQNGNRRESPTSRDCLQKTGMEYSKIQDFLRVPPVFLLCKGLNPAYGPRKILLKAGDIERNPGPVKSCDSCSIKITKGEPLKCSQADYNKVCHVITKCSGVRRTKNPLWFCKAHQNNSNTTAEESLICSSCNNQIKRGSTPLKCAACEAVCHTITKCSGIRRRTENPVWLCPNHIDTP